MRIATALALFLGLVLVAPAPARASAQDGKTKRPRGVMLTVEEALELAFPKADIQRGSVYLSEPERERLDKLSGEKFGKGILHPYRAYTKPAAGSKDQQGKLLGTVWFDTHKVRTVGETVMVVVDPADKVVRVEILAFMEPKKYLPKAKWFGQFLGMELGPEIDLERAIRGISGATMSCEAATKAVRRCLASHRLSAEQAAQKAAKRLAKKKAREAKAKKEKSGTGKPGGGSPPSPSPRRLP